MNDAPFPWVMLASCAQRNLLAVGRSYQQVADFVGAAAELRLHAHHQVEKLLALDDLRDGLTAYRGFDHGFHVGDVDSVTGNLVAVDVDRAGWAVPVREPPSDSANPGTLARMFLIWTALSCRTFRSSP